MTNITPTSSAEATRSPREVFTAISGLVVGMFVAVLSGTVAVSYTHLTLPTIYSV